MKKKKTIFAVVGGILAIALAVSIFCICRKDRGKDNTAKTESQPETSSEGLSQIAIDEPETDTVSEPDAGRITDDGTGMSPDETKADKVLETKKEELKKAKEPVNTPIEKKKETKKYVQDADPKTGISWDGKSKIIYSTVDGETTEPTYGGYYEIRPDEWVLYEYPTPKEEFDDKCPHCGRVSGDGTNGTCLRYSLVDDAMICPNCGVIIPAKTCHTCEEAH